MAGRYDITPLDTSTRNKLYGQLQGFEDQVLNDRDIDMLLGRYGRMEDEGLQQAWDAAQMEMSQQFSPAFDALRARNYGLQSGGQGNRDYTGLMQNLMGGLLGQRMGLGAESSGRKAAYARQLAMEKISGRQGRANALWGRMLTTQKRPTTGQQIAGAGLQLVGAGVGALAGGPAGAAAGAAMTPQMYQDQVLSPANVDWEERQMRSRVPGFDSIRPTSVYTGFPDVEQARRQRGGR